MPADLPPKELPPKELPPKELPPKELPPKDLPPKDLLPEEPLPEEPMPKEPIVKIDPRGPRLVCVLGLKVGGHGVVHALQHTLDCARSWGVVPEGILNLRMGGCKTLFRVVLLWVVHVVLDHLLVISLCSGCILSCVSEGGN